MSNHKALLNPRTGLLLSGARVLVACLAVNALVLHADEKEKDKDKKQESHPAPKPAPAQKPQPAPPPAPKPQPAPPKPQPQAPPPAAPKPQPQAPPPATPKPQVQTPPPMPGPQKPPVAPGQPGAPATPGRPITPGQAPPTPNAHTQQPTPAQPGAPATPGRQITPGQAPPTPNAHTQQPTPAQPGVPATPGRPAPPGQALPAPNAHAQQPTPGQPGVPATPGRPGTPGQVPPAPNAHAQPPAPVQPGHPGQPPVNPGTPSGRPGTPSTLPPTGSVTHAPNQGPGQGRPDQHQGPATRSEPPHPNVVPVRPGEHTQQQPIGGHVPERQVVRTREGGEIHRAPSGAIREVHTPSGAIIHHAPNGVRHVEVVRPGGRIIVANATGRSGYVQRPLVSHGYTYEQRTYMHNGVAHAAIYRPWVHEGREYHVYMSPHYYHPTFYSWVHTPWVRPVTYSWGWHSRPWYGYYGGYFTPYRTYASPSFWLADFIIAASLESAYLAQNASTSAPPVTYNSSTAMSPEVKDAIAQEVKRQMDQAKADQAYAQSSGVKSAPPPIFSESGPKVFLVSSSLTAYAGNQECPLAEGDVLQVVQTPVQDFEWADVKVLASRGSNCPVGSQLSVKTTDLQEMQNTLQASLDQGLAKLQSDQGKEGMPPLPPEAAGIVNAPYTNDIVPDANAQSELTMAANEANKSEQAIINEGAQYPAGQASGATVSLGMTTSQVENALGRPKSTVDLGQKKIYVYNDLKITFLNDRVSDVQ